VLTHEAVFRHMLDGAGPRLVCGDLNTPRREHSDGSVWTFARTRNGSLRPERGERWDAAETSLIRGLEPSGFRDAFRERHGYAVKEVSWAWPRGGGYRLDHLIVSEEVRVDDCRYLHEWRTELKLSDHSPLIADLAVAR
jgi:exonuclease III